MFLSHTVGGFEGSGGGYHFWGLLHLAAQVLFLFGSCAELSEWGMRLAHDPGCSGLNECLTTFTSGMTWGCVVWGASRAG